MKYQNRLENNRVQCNICPRECKLDPGQRGFCHVRKNVDGNVELTTYGYNTGLQIDPIEKKPLYHFYPGTKVLSLGTLGCNMGCKFCQNWQISKSKSQNEHINKTSPEEVVNIAIEQDCKSIAFTYNDPVIFFEYAIDTAKIAKEKGIKTIAVTAGFINPEPAKEFFEHMDAVNIDLKAFNNDFYKKICLAKLKPVLDTINYVKNQTNAWLELTTLLIEGENDSSEEIIKECQWIRDNLGVHTPLHFSAFFPAWKMNDKNPTSPQTLLKAYNIAKDIGLKYVYLGNILNPATSTTYCENCSNPLIIRDRYIIATNNLIEHGHCRFCNHSCHGRF